MSEEEKKLKEMEEFGVELILNPGQTVAKSSPTKLKLQALTFIIIGKIEKYFLENKLDKVKKAAKERLEQSSSMAKEEREAYTNAINSAVANLEKQVAIFNENYSRLIHRGKRMLKVPSYNLNKLDLQAKVDTVKNAVDMVESYKKMTDVFANTKANFTGESKDSEISKAEQENIRRSVYKALSGFSDKEIEDYSRKFDDTDNHTIDKFINKKENDKTKEEELDNFFDRFSPIKKEKKLSDGELNQALNGGFVDLEKKDLGKALNDGKVATPKHLSDSDLDTSLNKNEPVVEKKEFSSIFDDKPSLIVPDWLKKDTVEIESKKDEKPTEIPIFDNTLSNDDIAFYADKLTGKKETTIDDDIEKTAESLPDVDDLKNQLNESIKEIEQKRQAKEAARKSYEREKEARVKEEEELSLSKKENENLRKELERKKEEQKNIDELNQRVKRALEYQRQIEENKRAALEEEEETKKYQETLRLERENQNKVAEERAKVQSERATLQSETTDIDAVLRKKKAMLQETKRQLQAFATTDKVETAKYEDFFAQLPPSRPGKAR
ncbi:hypothetical protein EGP98_04390 [bacterium]|nr:hypothetical protein [bacterium]